MSKSKGKKKICFVMQRSYPIFNPNVEGLFGGAEVNLCYLAKEFARDSNVSVSFYVGDYGQKDVEYYDNVKVLKLKHVGISNKNHIFYKAFRSFMLFYQFYKTKSDVFILSTASEMLGKVALFKKFFRGKKIIFRMAHDGDANPSIWADPASRFYKLYTYGLRQVDRIISQTQNQKNILKTSLGLDSTTIKNGFPLEDDIELSQKKHILWVSRAMPMKRPELFVELARRLPTEKFVMIMPSNDENSEEKKVLQGVRDSIGAQIKSLPNVELIDYVPFHKIQDYFTHAKLFVNTSEYEGFPNTFIQSGIAKTPILSFNVNPDGIIEKYQFGCFCNNDTDMATDFIANLDEAKIRNFGEGTFRYVQEFHDIRVASRQYLEMIEAMLAGGKA